MSMLGLPTPSMNALNPMSSMNALNPFSSSSSGGATTDADSSLLAANQAIVEERPTTKASKAVITKAIQGAASLRPDVRFQGLLALVVLSENDENKTMIINGGALPHVLSASTSSDEKAQYAAARVLWHIAKSDGHKANLVQTDALAAISEICMSLISHVQYAAARILLHLSETEDIQDQILASDLPGKLASLVCVEAEQVQYVSACAIQNLAAKSPGHPAFTDEKMLKNLMSLVKIGSDNCQYAAIACLVSLGKHSATMKTLKEEGAVDLYVDVLSNSNNERVVYIAMTAIGEMGLNEFEMEEKLVKAGVMASVAAMLRSEKAILVKATANFIKGYANNAKVRDNVLENIGFEPFLKLLGSPEPSLMESATTILSSLLKEELARKQFVANGGMDSVKDLLGSDDLQLQLTALMLLWSLILAEENKQSVVNSGSLTTLADMTTSEDFTVSFVSSLTICQVSTSSEVGEQVLASPAMQAVKDFTSCSDWKYPSKLEFQTDDLTAMAALTENESIDVQKFAVWALSHICSKDENREMVMQAGVVAALTKIATSGTSDQAEMANEALGMFDASSIPDPEDLGDRITKYTEEISKEKEICDSLLEEHGQVAETVNSLDTEALGKLEVTDSTTVGMQKKYMEIQSLQVKIKSGQQGLLQKLSGMGDSMKMIKLKREGFERISRKVEVKERLDQVNEKILQLTKDLDEQNGLVGGVESQKVEADKLLETTNTSIEEMVVERTKKEAKRIELSDEIVDLKYQLENRPGMLEELNTKKKALEDQMAELLKQMEAIDADLATKEEALAKITLDIEDREKNLLAFEELKKTTTKLKNLRGELSSKYAADLGKITEYHGLMDSIINLGFAQLKDLGREPPAIANESKSFGPEEAAAATSYQQEKQSALDAELAAIEKELNRGKEELLGLKKDAEAALDSKKEEKRLLQEDIDKLQAQIDELDAKLGPLSDEDLLKEKLAALEAQLAEVEADLNGFMDKLKALEETKRDQMSKLYELSADLRKIQAAITRLSGELESEKGAYQSMYSRLEADLSEFALGLAEYVTKRAAIQAQFRPVLAAMAEWAPLIAQELALKIEAAELADVAIGELGTTTAELKASQLVANVTEPPAAGE